MIKVHILNAIEEQTKNFSQKLSSIETKIPYQSDLEKEYKKMLDANYELREQINVLKKEILDIVESNKKLLEYIENIEEVKEARKKGMVIESYYSPEDIPTRTFKIVEIPPIKIFTMVNEDR